MNLISNNIILLTNSQSPQEKLDNHELKNLFKNNQLKNNLFKNNLNNLPELLNKWFNKYKMLQLLSKLNLLIIHYQFPPEEWYKPQSELYNNQSLELYNNQSELQWCQLTNNNLSKECQLLDKVKECKCQSEQVKCQLSEQVNNQFTELQLAMLHNNK